MLGMITSIKWLLIPGLIFRMFIVISLFVISMVIYITNWDITGQFYLGIVPGVTGFVFLYFWLIQYTYFKEIFENTEEVTVIRSQQPSSTL